MTIPSMNFSQNTARNITDPYSRVSPVACWKLNLVSIYYMLLFLSSILVNCALLLSFVRIKKLRTPMNLFVIVFTGLSLIGSLSQAPFVILSNYYCK